MNNLLPCIRCKQIPDIYFSSSKRCYIYACECRTLTVNLKRLYESSENASKIWNEKQFIKCPYYLLNTKLNEL